MKFTSNITAHSNVLPSAPVYLIDEPNSEPMKLKTLSLGSAIGGLLIALAVGSCDVMHADPDLKAPVQINQNEVIALANGSTTIDIRSRVQATRTVTVSITSAPKAGTLRLLNDGLILYTATGSAGTRDSFGFDVYDSISHSPIASDSVHIILSDSTHLPCGVYPTNDYFMVGSKDTTFTFQVLWNDYLCGIDTTDVKLEIVQGDSIGPIFGVAGVTMVGNIEAVTYKRTSPIIGTDHFLYKVSSRVDPTKFGYGSVFVSESGMECKPTAFDDNFTFKMDTVQNLGMLTMNVGANDQLCPTDTLRLYYILGIPRGTASIYLGTMYYQPSGLIPGQSRVDTVQYQVCQTSGCSQAKVLIIMKN
jgi:hypothetical protein